MSKELSGKRPMTVASGCPSNAWSKTAARRLERVRARHELLALQAEAEDITLDEICSRTDTTLPETD